MPLCLLWAACGGEAPIWKGEAVLKDYTMHYNEEPLEFDLVVSQNETQTKGLFQLELELTYYVMISRSVLPLYVVIEDSRDYTYQEFNVKIPLKKEGEWQGEADNYETDYKYTKT